MTGDSHSPLDVARLVELTEVAAYADLLRAAPADWGCVAEETPAGWCLFAPALDLLLFNRIVGAGVSSPARQGDLQPLIARFRSAGLNSFGVQLSPAAQPEALADWLADAGLARRDRWTKVYRPAGPVTLAETDLRIEHIGPDRAELFAVVMTTGFGMPAARRPWVASIVGRPNWRHYLAWSGAEPVASAAMFVHDGAGWLGIASTLPAARRRGAQRALMARRLEDGHALGCRWFVTETGEDLPGRPNPSFHNMMRAGFTVAYHRPNFMP